MRIEERVYLNLVKVFSSNMEHSEIRLDKIITNVKGVPIEFNTMDLNFILGIKNEGLEIYTSRKELMFNYFFHFNTVRSICRLSDLSNDTCQLSFCLQLLALQV